MLNRHKNKKCVKSVRALYLLKEDALKRLENFKASPQARRSIEEMLGVITKKLRAEVNAVCE